MSELSGFADVSSATAPILICRNINIQVFKQRDLVISNYLKFYITSLRGFKCNCDESGLCDDGVTEGEFRHTRGIQTRIDVL